jgi:hypothetical protein
MKRGFSFLFFAMAVIGYCAAQNSNVMQRIGGTWIEARTSERIFYGIAVTIIGNSAVLYVIDRNGYCAKFADESGNIARGTISITGNQIEGFVSHMWGNFFGNLIGNGVAYWEEVREWSRKVYYDDDEGDYHGDAEGLFKPYIATIKGNTMIVNSDFFGGMVTLTKQ